MKTSELIDLSLDWAVAKAERLNIWTGGYYEAGISGCQLQLVRFPYVPYKADALQWVRGAPYSPSTNWAQSGPIIEREGIFPTLTDIHRDDNGSVSFTEMFRARTPAQYLDHDEGVYGPTPLIAAMRCYVVSKLGDEVDIPKELM